MAKDEKDGKFFAVRDLPADTRKKIKRYAVDNDLTMAQALEALVEGRYGTQADRALIEALMRVYGRVIIEDISGAQTEAKQVTELLEQRRLQGRIDPAFQLPAPTAGTPTTRKEASDLEADREEYERKVAKATDAISMLAPDDVALMNPNLIVSFYFTALYMTGQYEFAAGLLSKGTILRSLNPLSRVAEILREYRESLPRCFSDYQDWTPVFSDPERDDRCEVKVKFLLATDDGTETIEVARTVLLDKEYLPPDPNATNPLIGTGYWHWAISNSGIDEHQEWFHMQSVRDKPPEE